MARAMKDSGIEWIGEIPEGWQLSRIKYVSDFEPKCDFSNLSVDDTITYTPMENIKNGYYIPNTAPLGTLSTSLTAYQHNDIVMAKVTPCFENGNIAVMNGLSSGVGLGSSELFVFRAKEMQTRYLFYWLQNKAFVEQAKSTMTGTGGLKRVSPQFMRDCAIHCPPPDEQAQISAFLDAECARIDAVIKQTRTSIEEYKKLKQSVITQAVTNGIRPGRKMKDSGNNDIGCIPNEWEIVRLKYLTTDIIDCPHETPEYSAEGEYLVIRTADQDYARLRSDSNMLRLNYEQYVNRTRRMTLDKDDIVYGREGERWGLACLVPESERYCLGQRMMQFRCDQKRILPLFAMYALSSSHVRRQGEYDTFGSTSPHVNISTIRNYRIPLPSISEQKEICEYIHEKVLYLDMLVDKKEKAVADLEFYKKSLIFEYVTGKKEVR